MKHYAVLGLDLSLTSTGYCYRASSDEIVTGRIVPGNLRGLERLDFLESQLISVIREAGQGLVDGLTHAIVEDYSMGNANRGSPGRFFHMGEWGGIARRALWRRDLDILLAAPAQVKILATGNGGAATKKPQVMAGVLETWNYEITNDDEADAFVLMHLGEATIDRRKARRYPEKKARAIQSVKWLTGNLAD